MGRKALRKGPKRSQKVKPSTKNAHRQNILTHDAVDRETAQYKGKRAYLPLLHEINGKEVPIVAECEYRNSKYRPVRGKRYDTFEEADVEAHNMNKRAGIPPDVWWTIGEWMRESHC